MLEDTNLLMVPQMLKQQKPSTFLFVVGPYEDDGGGADEVGGAEETRSVAVCARLPRLLPSLMPVQVFLSAGRSRMLTFGRRGAVNGGGHRHRPVAAALQESGMRPNTLVFYKQTEFCRL